MTQSLGPATAKAFGDAHEVSAPNAPAETQMDLFNNAMGREFAQTLPYSSLTPDQAANQAMHAGCLRLAPEN